MDEDELERIAASLPRPVRIVIAMLGAVLRAPGHDADDLLERTAAPGTLDYWRSLTDYQLGPLRDLTPELTTTMVAKDLVHVRLIPKSAVPEPETPDQHVQRIRGTFPAFTAVVRFFADVDDWRVERLGDLGPPRLEVLD